MLKPYEPCKDCKQPKETCSKCGYKNLEKEYHRALTRLIELNRELGRELTILI